MKKASRALGADRVKAMLDKHGCPVPYHAVRTRFLGSIASPDPAASPMRTVKRLWGGELPAFESVEELNELLDVLVNGFWNDLTRHQKRSQPFRLIRTPTEPTAANLGHLTRVRLEEIDGFIDGLFDGREALELPERAYDAVEEINEILALLDGVCDLVSRGIEAESRAEIEATFRSLRELTRVMEVEINEAVLSCTRSQRRMLAATLAEKPTRH